ncbi:Heavy metal-associated domain [Theobroma cacao]|uniref:Heavy metal transport/detoxification superfamily protein, putative n=1 Tax=Theobroma cacao TaxID=3641 RepID=A0A061F5E9_THECC|nr:Heavy metal transport/detoxification superfamily protein, putative [Theobroma cacao]WRX28524.1 Heavy metal-associated domain [Theobroma cacao]
MKQKIVIKVPMHCDKCRTKAMKIAAVANGVSSVAIAGNDKDQVVVTGEGIDSANLTCLLRKKLGYAAIISVGEDKKKDGDKDKKPEIHQCSSFGCCQCPNYCTLHYGVVYDDPNPTICSIM